MWFSAGEKRAVTRTHTHRVCVCVCVIACNCVCVCVQLLAGWDLPSPAVRSGSGTRGGPSTGSSRLSGPGFQIRIPDQLL